MRSCAPLSMSMSGMQQVCTMLGELSAETGLLSSASPAKSKQGMPFGLQLLSPANALQKKGHQSPTLESSCQQAAGSFHQVIRRIGAAREQIANLGPIEHTARPVTFKCWICWVRVHLHHH